MSWLKWHIGTVDDPRFRLIARYANLNIRDILCIWAAMLEYAADARPRGTLIGWDSTAIGAAIGLSGEKVHGAFLAMQGRLLDGVFIAEWKRYKAPLNADWLDRLGLTLDEWAAVRSRIFKRDGFTCQYCGIAGVYLECDHVVPLSAGGSSEDSNLATACRSCNRSKKDRLLSEWRVN